MDALNFQRDDAFCVNEDTRCYFASSDKAHYKIAGHHGDWRLEVRRNDEPKPFVWDYYQTIAKAQDGANRFDTVNA